MYYAQNNTLAHHGIKGQKWGERRFQNEDGTLTPAGEERYRKQEFKQLKKAVHRTTFDRDAYASLYRHISKDKGEDYANEVFKKAGGRAGIHAGLFGLSSVGALGVRRLANSYGKYKNESANRIINESLNDKTKTDRIELRDINLKSGYGKRLVRNASITIGSSILAANVIKGVALYAQMRL